MDIQHASLYSGKSQKTLRRLIHKGTLPGPLIAGKYDLQASDLDALSVEHPPDTLSTRMSALEDRVHVLEGLVSSLTTHLPSRRLTAPRATYEPRTASERDTLPEGLVPLAEFYHGIPETTVRRSLTSGVLPVQRGTWKKDGHLVHLALDAPGRVTFYALYHEHPHFTPCENCPHHEP
jgi:hypothetical protein